jgi:hypothetical protein
MNTGLRGFYTLKVEWSLNVAPGLTFTNSTLCPHSVFMCFVWISEQTAIISLYSINWLVCITETESVYCAVRAGSLKMIEVNIVSTFTVRWMHKTGKKAVLFDNSERIVLSPVANFLEVTEGEVSIQKVLMGNSKPTAELNRKCHPPHRRYVFFTGNLS